MSAQGHPPSGEEIPPATVLGRVADGIDKYVEPVYRWMGYLAALVIMAVTVAMIYSVFGNLAGHPLDSSTDITEYGLLLMIALAAGIEHLGHEKMTVDAVSRTLPKRVQAFIAPIIFILVVVILIVAVWQLIRLGMYLQDKGWKTKGSLRMSQYPFTYVLAAGVATLIPIYFARALRAFDRLVKR